MTEASHMAEQAALLKQGLEEKRGIIEEEHWAGSDGFTVCSRLRSVVDETIISLFTKETGNFCGAMIAIGGYGRGILNPFSDIDILFLLTGKRDETGKPPHVMLAGLWDLGLKVGHSSRTIADTVTVGFSDITARTAMSEHRFLAGDRELYDGFRKKYDHKVVRYKPNLYIREKYDALMARRNLHGGVSLLTEPDIKESPGGLRDLHTVMWMMRSKSDVTTIEEMAKRGMMSPEDVEPVNRAHSFLLRLRNSLHFTTGKQTDTLSYGHQPAIARSEGFSDGSDNQISASLMYRYYEAAQTIERFTNEMIRYANSYRRKWSFRPVQIDADNLFTDKETLRARAFPPDVYEDKQDILYNIAARISNEALALSPNLTRGLEKTAKQAPSSWFEGERAGQLFMRILNLHNAGSVLSEFHATGILARFIPEFEQVTRLSQFDMYHRYTVDEHTLTAVRELELLPSAEGVSDVLKQVFRSIDNIALIKLILLIHDIGKKAEDRHLVEDDTHTEKILNRLGLERYIETVGPLVRNHVLMSATAQRFDFSRPEALRKFCNTAGDLETMKMLYLITYADIKAVGPKIWNNWKDMLLDDLYGRAKAYYLEGEAVFKTKEEQALALAKLTAKQYAGAYEESMVADFLAMAPHQYLTNADPETITADIDLVESRESGAVALRYQANPGDDTCRITMAASERIGFFSIVAGAFAAKNVNVVDAQIHTLPGHLALNTVTLGGANLDMFAEPASLKRFEKELTLMVKGEKDVQSAVARRTRYLPNETKHGLAAFEPTISIVNTLSRICTVIEVWAPDRIGLLYDITRTLAGLRLDIKTAKVSTEGPKAISIFYVNTETGKKIEDKAGRKRVEEALLSAILSPAGVD